MKIKTWRLAVAALVGVVALGARAGAQPSAAGPEFLVPSGAVAPSDPDLAVAPDGSFVVVWTEGDPSGSPSRDGDGTGVFGRVFDAAGKPLGPDFQVNESAARFQDSPTVVLTRDGFVVAWQDRPEEFEAPTVRARRFDRRGAPQGGDFPLASDPTLTSEHVRLAAMPDGGFLAVWAEGSSWSFFGLEDPRVVLRRFDAAGAAVGPAAAVNVAGRDPAVATDAAGGSMVVWVGASEDDLSRRQAYGRRFDPAGRPASAPFPLGSQADTSDPDVSCTGAGDCVAAWQSTVIIHEVWVRRFPAAGAPGREIPVVWVVYYSSDVLVEPRVSCDAAGGFALTWRDPGDQVGAARFDPAGRRQGPVFTPVTPGRPWFQGGVSVAGSAADGDFVLAYGDALGDDPPAPGIVARRFRLPPSGAEPCRYRPGGRLSCDVFHDGGAAELQTQLAGAAPGDVPLLGDLDGDGRDDLCAYRAGRFRCDLRHDGESYREIAFGGTPGDRPLLADVNGDGRDDPCVRRGRRFLCDTAHDGGTAEVVVAFGLASDLPLLGDVDGDGDDEPCVFRGGLFLCDAAHDGGAAEVAIAFGQAGDVPFLADADHDGRDDACVYHEEGGSGRFLCDTAHDGGSPEVEIPFDAAGATPLFGDLNGI